MKKFPPKLNLNNTFWIFLVCDNFMQLCRLFYDQENDTLPIDFLGGVLKSCYTRPYVNSRTGKSIYANNDECCLSVDKISAFFWTSSTTWIKGFFQRNKKHKKYLSEKIAIYHCNPEKEAIVKFWHDFN